MKYDCQYYREHKPGLNGWSEGWTLYNMHDTEAGALLACVQNARTFQRKQWRVVDGDGNVAWILHGSEDRNTVVIQRG